jgi:hypothetical protein
LFFKSISVVDELVINNLSNKRDRSLSEILISLGHVKIIQEVDQNFARWWTVVLTSLLNNLRFKQGLERFGISVGVERHTGAESSLSVDSGQEILNVGGLSSTSFTDVKHTLSGENMHVQEESLASGGRGRNDEVLVKTLIFLVHWRSDSVPSNPLGFDRIKVVVEALTIIRESFLVVGSHGVGEGVLVFVETTSKTPHSGEDEEGIIDGLDLFLLVLLLEHFEVLKLGLISVEFLIEIIDDASNGSNFLHVARRSNVMFGQVAIHSTGRHVRLLGNLECSISDLILLILGQPRVEVSFPSDISDVYEQDTTS